MQLGGCADFLHHFIWSYVSSVMQFRNIYEKEAASVHKILCKSWKKCDGSAGND
jgi:hypothetical protein